MFLSCCLRKENENRSFGRPTEDARPSIAVQERFISRRHGCFHTDGDRTIFEAYKTTNGVHYRGRALLPGETVELKDGDELMIPAEENGQMLLVYASSPSRIRFWRELESAYMDQLTGLGNRDSLRHWWKLSIGYVEINAVSDPMDIEGLVEMADKALYEVKRSGKGGVQGAC